MTPNRNLAVHGCYRQIVLVLSERITENIKALREERGLSRGQLGQMLTPQVPRQTIEKLEKGERPLTVEWIERLAVALQVDPAALVAGEAGKFELTEQVSAEVARSLARVAMRGAEPESSTVLVLSLMLQELFDMFARHPATRTDLQAARPAIDFLTRQHER